ncbi:cyclin-like protein [Multifurca ochricompacta]|uniref:Cyclin-like protein n=1 Tax=Multifurca ochricompacta TaxID=376703 RepID=A0AAD4M7Y7_9AGAM|nr:cyclin-like protein [Multifurca ochricompacta]
MAHRLPLRNRTGIQRPKNLDENATSKLRQAVSTTLSSGIRDGVSVANALKTSGVQRPALGEVAVNRKNSKSKPNKDKAPEVGQKRARSSSVADGPQRIPLAAKPTALAAQATVTGVRSSLPQRPPLAQTLPPQRVFSPPPEPTIVHVEGVTRLSGAGDDMDIEDVHDTRRDSMGDIVVVGDEELENMIDEQDRAEVVENLVPIEEPDVLEYVWPDASPNHAAKYEREVEEVRARFDAEDEEYDATMCSEYADDIFQYMCDLEDAVMPTPNYMDAQNEITWGMRQTLVDWLLQVHLRYHMLPETLWIAVNIVDRFLSHRTVSLVKLQLVGEILAPSAEEFVFMTENGYTKEEILKGERIVLQTLEFNISHYCSPYSWMRKISHADDYDIQTRTLSKFLAEVTLLDHRFLRVKPSMVAAVGMYTARRMLGGDWQLEPGYHMLVEKITEPGFDKLYLYKKYAHKKFLKAAVYALEKAREQVGQGEGMVLA